MRAYVDTKEGRLEIESAEPSSKAVSVVLYLLGNANGPVSFATLANALFTIDTANYAVTGYSMTGLVHRKTPAGTEPDGLRGILADLCSRERIHESAPDVFTQGPAPAPKPPMTLAEYQTLARRTANPDADMGNVVLGLFGEIGELADLVKKAKYHGHSLDLDRIADEAGDVLWYCAEGFNLLDEPMKEHERFWDGAPDSAEYIRGMLNNACLFANGACTQSLLLGRIVKGLRLFLEGLDLSLSEVAERNIEKLRERYPDKFDPERSRNRAR